MEELLIGVERAAKLLGISTSKLYKCAEKKEIPSVKIGERLLFSPQTLKAWISEKEKECHH